MNSFMTDADGEPGKEIPQERPTKAELEACFHQAAQDFLLQFSHRLKEQLYFPIIKEQVRLSLHEPDFLKKVLQQLIVHFVESKASSVDIIVGKELRTTLGSFMASAIFDQLEKNPHIRLLDEEGLEGFILCNRKDHYIWDFRTETIAKELCRLVEPQLKKYFQPT